MFVFIRNGVIFATLLCLPWLGVALPVTRTGSTSLPPTGSTSLPPAGSTSLPPTGSTSLPPAGSTSLPCLRTRCPKGHKCVNWKVDSSSPLMAYCIDNCTNARPSNSLLELNICSRFVKCRPNERCMYNKNGVAECIVVALPLPDDFNNRSGSTAKILPPTTAVPDTVPEMTTVQYSGSTTTTTTGVGIWFVVCIVLLLLFLLVLLICCCIGLWLLYRRHTEKKARKKDEATAVKVEATQLELRQLLQQSKDIGARRADLSPQPSTTAQRDASMSSERPKRDTRRRRSKSSERSKSGDRTDKELQPPVSRIPMLVTGETPRRHSTRSASERRRPTKDRSSGRRRHSALSPPPRRRISETVETLPLSSVVTETSDEPSKGSVSPNADATSPPGKEVRIASCPASKMAIFHLLSQPQPHTTQQHDSSDAVSITLALNNEQQEQWGRKRRHMMVPPKFRQRSAPTKTASTQSLSPSSRNRKERQIDATSVDTSPTSVQPVDEQRLEDPITTDREGTKSNQEDSVISSSEPMTSETTASEEQPDTSNKRLPGGKESEPVETPQRNAIMKQTPKLTKTEGQTDVAGYGAESTQFSGEPSQFPDKTLTPQRAEVVNLKYEPSSSDETEITPTAPLHSQPSNSTIPSVLYIQQDEYD